jgi:hypothetical protein
LHDDPDVGEDLLEQLPPPQYRGPDLVDHRACAVEGLHLKVKAFDHNEV